MKRPQAQAAKESTSIDLVVLAEFVEQFPTKTVAVLGDFVADEFQFGEISRVSREAPVLILRHRETHLVPGGGANAANNLAALGARVLPITAVGHDHPGDALIAYFEEKRIDTSGILRVKGHTTPTKTRFLAGWAHTVGQQVLRVDREPQTPLSPASHKRIEQLLHAKLRSADALAVSDYGFDIATPLLVRKVTAKRKSLVVTLDARYALASYARSGVTSATPNEAELESLHHTAIGTNIDELARCGRATLSAMKLRALLVTRGRDGMALFEAPPGRLTHIPIHGSNQAVDVTGAGDTVLAAYTLALASGASPLEAAHIANIAGGLVVMKRGTATVTRHELLEAIRGEVSGTSA